MATLKQIAQAAGVTVSTVSLALNNEKGVHNKTRQKIVAIAQQVNDELLAQQSAQSAAQNIGIIWEPAKGLYFLQFCHLLEQLAAKHGMDVIVMFSPPDQAFRQLYHLNINHIML